MLLSASDKFKSHQSLHLSRNVRQLIVSPHPQPLTHLRAQYPSLVYPHASMSQANVLPPYAIHTFINRTVIVAGLVIGPKGRPICSLMSALSTLSRLSHLPLSPQPQRGIIHPALIV